MKPGDSICCGSDYYEVLAEHEGGFLIRNYLTGKVYFSEGYGTILQPPLEEEHREAA